MNQKIKEILQQIEKVVVGKNENVEKIMMAILAGGHVLMEDVPGTGKTTTAMTFAKVLGMDTRRVQFTSDTVPSDIIGYSVYDKESGGFGPGYGQLAEDYIGKNGYVLYRDNGAPYLYKEETGEFICFDDPVSVAEKTHYVKDNGLAGIMYWEHSCDPTKALLTAIDKASKD